MCEIFPEVEHCCFVFSVRVGMLFIAIFSISSGTIGLGLVEQKSNYDYKKAMTVYDNTLKIKKPQQVMSMLSNYISTVITFMSVVFIFAGVFLLYSDLADEEGFTQLFVWMVFVNIVIGMVVILAIGLECISQKNCLLGNMDWLSAATSLVMMVFYLILWFYFISVANSYVINGYS